MKKNRLSQILELPREIDSNNTKITIDSFSEILIENYKGVLEYEEFYIKVSAKIGIININGFNLELNQLTEDDIIIKGIINGIDLERVEG